MDMNCKQSEAWMMEALDGALLASDTRRLMAHLEGCSRCRVEWQALNALEGVLTNAPVRSPEPGFPGRVEARIARFEAQRRTLIGGLILLGAAAALCLMAVPSLLNGQGPLQAYGAFLRTAYDLLGYTIVLGYRLLVAGWYVLDALARSADVGLVNLLIVALALLLGALAWGRDLVAQHLPTNMSRNSG
jgi:predicted anti-sigma-YlaC factor YlaD